MGISPITPPLNCLPVPCISVSFLLCDWHERRTQTQEYQGTLGSISQWKYANHAHLKGEVLGIHVRPERLHMKEHWNVQPVGWKFSTPGVARWLPKRKTHAQGGLQWKYTHGGTMHIEAPLRISLWKSDGLLGHGLRAPSSFAISAGEV